MTLDGHFGVPGSKRIEVPRTETNQYDPLTSVLTSLMESEGFRDPRPGGEHPQVFGVSVLTLTYHFDHSRCCQGPRIQTDRVPLGKSDRMAGS